MCNCRKGKLRRRPSVIQLDELEQMAKMLRALRQIARDHEGEEVSEFARQYQSMSIAFVRGSLLMFLERFGHRVYGMNDGQLLGVADSIIRNDRATLAQLLREHELAQG